jgi:hypothetical protein
MRELGIARAKPALEAGESMRGFTVARASTALEAAR